MYMYVTRNSIYLSRHSLLSIVVNNIAIDFICNKFLDEAEEETLPQSVPTPTPTPHNTSYSGTIVARNIPDGVEDWVLVFYLQNLTGVPYQKIQMKGAMAVVEMKRR